jgi:hypothetical protein
MSQYSDAQEAYAAYLNGLPRAREHFSPEELEKYEADLQKAKDDLDTAWCEGLMEE